MANENQKPTEGPTRDGGSGGTCCSGAGKWMWLVLAVAIGAVFFAKSPCRCRPPKGSAPAATPISPANTTEPEAPGQGKLLPRLVDLGATQCIPCKMMAPMLAVTFKLAATNLSYGIFLLLLYGVGHCSVIVLAGTSTELVEHYLKWNEKSKGALILKKVCGVLVLLGGVWLIYTAP